MSSLRLRYETFEFAEFDIHVRALRDTQQFSDDEGEAESLGISSAAWPLFGVVWESGRALAHLMAGFAIDGRRVLEVGCGIGLASLVLNCRDVDISATDRHPLAAAFLKANVDLNCGAPIPFVRAGWLDVGETELGRFDLIIGSDLLYERDQARLLANFVNRHSRPTCEVVIIDPSRGQRGAFTRHMVDAGFVCTRHAAEKGRRAKSFRGEVLTYKRTQAG